MLVLQGRSLLPRHALAAHAGANEAELAALDGALAAAAAPREGAAGKAGSRDREQKHAMKDWLTALLLKRESAMHAAGIDVEGEAAHAAATGKAAGVGESVLKERQCLVQNLEEPVRHVKRHVVSCELAKLWSSVTGCTLLTALPPSPLRPYIPTHTATTLPPQLVLTSKQNKRDASEWQSCAAELGTGSLFDGDDDDL